MKTRWIIAGAAVLLVAGAMPWGIGYVTEMQWQQATRELNQSQPVLQVQTDAYRRGLLSAELEGELVVKHPETGERQRIPYQASVSHGVLGSLMDFEPAGGWNAVSSPFVPIRRSRIERSSAYVSELGSPAPPASIAATVSFNTVCAWR